MQNTNKEDKNSVAKVVAEFLKQKRIAMGLTVRNFSIFLYGHDKNCGNLSLIENGKKNIGLKKLNFLLKKLNCSITINEH